jgi:membrane-anchored mycosin MYCP
VFRGMAAAGLTIALCLVAAPVLSAPALASGKPTSKTAQRGTSQQTESQRLAPGPLPAPVSQCLSTTGSTAAKLAPKGMPWAEKALDYQGVWKFTQGRGVTVAVIDSGVDENPQYDGRVIVGQNFAAAPAGPADGDCAGHGTAVAGIIAAAPKTGISFAGVAPQATILSIKITNSTTGIQPSVVADAIIDAVNDGARVINVSLIAPNSPGLQNAVNYALHRNVVVVAAAGNDTPNTGTGPFYPAAYPGVLSVGAVDSTGARADFSDTKTPVTVTAPGVNVISTYPGFFPRSYAPSISGTSFAAPFVAGVAALVRSTHPTLSAAGVVYRIKATAEGSAGPGTGNGLVNPVEAVTAILPSEPVTSPTGAAGRVSVDRTVPDPATTVMAMSMAGGAVGVAVLVIAAAVVIPAGRRRRWRPGGNS